MDSYVTGGVIRALREKKKMNQRELAEALCVSDKTVSKWETGRGLPDISLLEPLAAALGVSLTELLAGELVSNANRSANLLRGRWHVCPACGNVVWAAGEGVFSCCGIRLPPLTVEEPGSAHAIRVQRVEDDWYVTLDHPMTREHGLRFAAYVTCDRVQLVRLYPEQDASVRFPISGAGSIYVYCNRHGLFERRV